jgi:hypothetical protein
MDTDEMHHEVPYQRSSHPSSSISVFFFWRTVTKWNGRRTTAPTTTSPMFKRSALEYAKEVLDKISFADRSVFRKELRKAFRRLTNEERQELKQWFRSACLCRVPTLDPVRVRISGEE